MTPHQITAIHGTGDASTLHLDFNFSGRCIGRFEIPIEFYADHLDALPPLDPFEVIEALIDHLHAYGSQEVVMANHIRATFLNHHSHVMSCWLYSELDRTVRERASLESQVRELLDYEISLRNELQSLPIAEETAPVEEAAS